MDKWKQCDIIWATVCSNNITEKGTSLCWGVRAAFSDVHNFLIWEYMLGESWSVIIRSIKEQEDCQKMNLESPKSPIF